MRKSATSTGRQGQDKGQGEARADSRTVLTQRLVQAEDDQYAILQRLGFLDVNAVLDSFKQPDGRYAVGRDRPSQNAYAAVLAIRDLKDRRLAIWDDRESRKSRYDVELLLR